MNGRHVWFTGNGDDSWGWTDGWQGNMQFLYVGQSDGGDNIVEAYNREADEHAQPRSMPAIGNMAAYGLVGENGLRLRRGTGLFLTNSYLDGSSSCLQIEGESLALLGTDLTIAGSSFGCQETVSGDDSGEVMAYLDSADEVSTNGGEVNAVPPSNAFFEAVDYVGAFIPGAEDWTTGWTIAGSVNNGGAPSVGCPAGTTAGSELNGAQVCELEGEINQNITLTAGNYYELVGKVVIGGDNANSATLTVPAGTTVYGGTSSDFLVISRGSELVVNGTRNAPVTFTSIEDLNGNVSDTTRGLWGGVVINGNAPINDCPEGAEGGTTACTKEGEANSGLFGGADSEDSSGSLRYMVVKYAGSNVDPENQLNGIAFQGVGSGTSVEFVQVYNNLDDGIEFFGGTVNAKYVVLTGNADDSLDWTDGWQGSIQYLQIDQADDAGDNGIEADNREGDENAQPRSMPSIANMTINGNSGERGVLLRRGTGLFLYNSRVDDNATCLDVSGESVALLGTDIIFDGVELNCPTVVDGDNAELQSFLNSSNVAENGSVAPADLTGSDIFEPTDFVGAVESAANDWVAGWTVGMPDTEVPVEGCPSGTTEGAAIAGTPTCTLSGTINSDLTLTRGYHYVLDGQVVVGGDNASSAVLTVQSGTTIIGDDDDDFLVISRGSQIVANGTEMSPVVLTAIEDVEGSIDLGNARGLWGGLVINGKAPINDCPEGAQGGTFECTKEGEANSGLFGGADPDASSGVLNYVVVKYARSNIHPENQHTGIAFQGVGAGTVVDYIQVHNNLDDGVEFFGGTVNAKHVVLSGHADDSLDWTDGWTGSLQFVHIVQAADAGDNGIEADNREGDENAQPRSNPSIANMTIDGNSGERGILLRRGTGADIWNSRVTGSAVCIDVAGESVALLGTDINLTSVALQCQEVVDGDNPDLQMYLDGAPNVTQDGSIPPASTLPSNGFFEQSDVVGSDVESWKGAWVFGL